MHEPFWITEDAANLIFFDGSCNLVVCKRYIVGWHIDCHAPIILNLGKNVDRRNWIQKYISEMKLTLLYCALYLAAFLMINMTTGLCSENAELKIKVAGHGKAGSIARGKHFFPSLRK